MAHAYRCILFPGFENHLEYYTFDLVIRKIRGLCLPATNACLGNLSRRLVLEDKYTRHVHECTQ